MLINEQSGFAGPGPGFPIAPQGFLSRSISSARLFVLLAALASPFGLLLCVTSVRSAIADMSAGDVHGVVFTVDRDGGRSVLAGARVKLEGPAASRKTVTDQKGNYSFAAVTPAEYQIQVEASGLVGSKTVTVGPGAALDAPIQMEIGTVKESVTVKATTTVRCTDSGETVSNKSTVLDAPNKYDRFDHRVREPRPGYWAADYVSRTHFSA
jgi:hypothetical protein